MRKHTCRSTCGRLRYKRFFVELTEELLPQTILTNSVISLPVAVHEGPHGLCRDRQGRKVRSEKLDVLAHASFQSPEDAHCSYTTPTPTNTHSSQSFSLLGLYIAGVIILTRADGIASSAGNLYYSSWVCFFNTFWIIAKWRRKAETTPQSVTDNHNLEGDNLEDL